MPSPRFGGGRPVVVDAVALAVREAWACADPTRRVAVMQRALRLCLGGALAGQVLSPAIALLGTQPEAPAGDLEPPAIAVLDLCPRCRTIKLREERRPYRGKVRMEALRDPVWMARQFEQLHKTEEQVAEDLHCCSQSVANWRRQHGIDAPKSNRVYMDEGWLRRHLIDQQLAPGEVAELAGCEAHSIRHYARALGVVATSREFAHCTRRWWAERVAAGWTQYRMAQAAGLSTHAVLHHLRKWGLYNPDRASKKRQTRYPKLYEPGWLAGQLKGRTLEQIAAAVGCSPTLVTFAAKKLGLREPEAPKAYPWTRDPAWYQERFARRLSAAAMATEAGVSEKSIINYMGELGLLEEYHRRVERWSDEQLQRTREATIARQAGKLRAAAAVA